MEGFKVMVDAGKLLLVMISYGYVVDDDDVVANWFGLISFGLAGLVMYLSMRRINGLIGLRST